MAAFPLPLGELLGHYGAYVVYLLIGVGFGAVLESAGFGNSKKLAAQFYFRDLTVFKVMFTAIIVACTLVFLASAFGLLDYNLVWVPPTYLWPGIVGGLIMGVGFIVGGFCPGTSLVGMVTGKVDGLFFVFGVLFGIFLFGETVASFDVFFNSSYLGRFTLPEWLGVDYGVVVVGVVVMALAMFWGAERLESAVGGPTAQPAPRWAPLAATALVALAVTSLVVGQPDNADRWRRIEAEQSALLEQRAVQIEPAELLSLIHDARIRVEMLDLREERHYNQFHIRGARRLPPDRVVPAARELMFEPANTVFVTMGNDEAAATEAWKQLRAESLPNVYILDGGVNHWIDTFSDAAFRETHQVADRGDERPAYRFETAIGARHPAAEPNPRAFDLEFEPKVKLEIKRAAEGGGCG